MRNLTSAFLAVLALSACGGSASNPAPATPAPAAGEVQRVPFVRTTVSGSTRVRWRVPVREGQLTDSQLVALAPRIARIKAEPDSIVLGPRDSVAMAEVVRVLAIADDGTVLGEIRRYTYQFSGLDQDSLGLMRPLRPGRAEWMAMIPLQAPGAFRTRGPAEVRVIITDSAGRILPEPPLPRGTARLSGIVTDDAGRPVVGALVSVSLMEPTGPRRLALVGTDDEGRFDIRDLPAGSVSIIVSGGLRPPVAAAVTMRDGSTTQRNFTLGGPTRD